MKQVKQAVLIFLRGVLMGIADIIPGISGGTMALITGIYERLIFAIRGVTANPVTCLLKGDFRGFRKGIRGIDWKLLIPLGAGIGLSFLAMSRVIKFFIDAYPANTYAFFFGLILASTAFVYRHVSSLTPKAAGAAVIGFFFTFLLVGMGTLQSSHSLPVVFFSGLVAICAMILPGISGAFMLLLLGQYEYMLTALQSLNLPVIAVFMTGAVVSLFGMASVLGYLIKNHKSVTMAFLVGIMLGSLRLPYQNVISNSFDIISVAVAGAGGFIAVIATEAAAKMAEK